MRTELDTADSARPTESIPQLLKDLRDETTLLLRQEVALAKQEVSEKASKAARNLGYLITGGLIAYAGAVVLLIAIAALVYYLLAEVAGMDNNYLAGFLAFLVTGLLVTIVGGAMISKALATLKEISMVPERTVESLKNDKDWIKQKVTS